MCFWLISSTFDARASGDDFVVRAWNILLTRFETTSIQLLVYRSVCQWWRTFSMTCRKLAGLRIARSSWMICTHRMNDSDTNVLITTQDGPLHGNCRNSSLVPEWINCSHIEIATRSENYMFHTILKLLSIDHSGLVVRMEKFCGKFLNLFDYLFVLLALLTLLMSSRSSRIRSRFQSAAAVKVSCDMWAKYMHFVPTSIRPRILPQDYHQKWLPGVASLVPAGPSHYHDYLRDFALHMQRYVVTS